MAQKIFSLNEEYSPKILRALTEIGGEIVYLNAKRRDGSWKTYHVSDTGATVVYGGNSRIAIAGTMKSIQETKSKLEKEVGGDFKLSK